MYAACPDITWPDFQAAGRWPLAAATVIAVMGQDQVLAVLAVLIGVACRRKASSP